MQKNNKNAIYMKMKNFSGTPKQDNFTHLFFRVLARFFFHITRISCDTHTLVHTWDIEYSGNNERRTRTCKCCSLKGGIRLGSEQHRETRISTEQRMGQQKYDNPEVWLGESIRMQSLVY